MRIYGRILTALLLAAVFVGGRAYAAPEEFYFGVYLKNAKVGHAVMKREPGEREGKRAIRSDSLFVLDIRMLGAPTRVENTSVLWSDATGAPLALEYRSESAGRVTSVTATYSTSAVSYRADVMGTVKSGTLALKSGERFLPDAGSGAPLRPEPGLRIVGKVFSPETLSLLDSETTVKGAETVTIGGQSVSAYRVIDKNTLATSTLWLTDSGELLRLESVMGIEVRREPREQALAAPSEKTDLSLVTGITPSGTSIDSPRTARQAQYEIRGASKPFPLRNGTRQRVAYTRDANGALVARVTIAAHPLPATAKTPLWKPGQQAPSDLKPYLQSTEYIPSDSPPFRRLAQAILGKERDRARAAAKISAWVHKKITPDPTISALRTADDILRTPRGVCRDYTTLYTAIARAAGLPTRQCVGVAYAGGRFLYHAWPEVWIGGDRWIALEPTWGAAYADATHIKLAEGEITDIYRLANDLGAYEIKVLEIQ